ncbi:NUDIX domain-containing protein [Streptomyces sp. NPDC041003]|uniref:NUDIX hydrolase n=1 Tax=Streptomyces sp. NPDC041003 TaxID=3155730 RepID=UPI0033C70055
MAGAVVREDGPLPAIRRADCGTWELPGGVPELDETPQDGVRREVFVIRLLDALDNVGAHVRSHDGGRLTTSSQ